MIVVNISSKDILKNGQTAYMKYPTKNLSGRIYRIPINLDITHKCTLQCQKCMRQNYGQPQIKFDIKEHIKDLKEMSLEDYEKIIEVFSHVDFCGQIGDPIFHTQFHKLLEMSKNVTLRIHSAATQRPREWYKKSFETNPKAIWIFGLDGLPEESHIYRVNQDGKKLFEVMKLAVSMNINIYWKYILFKYNQDHIKEAFNLAKKEHMNFRLVQSGRWKAKGEYDDLRPTISTTVPEWGTILRP